MALRTRRGRTASPADRTPCQEGTARCGLRTTRGEVPRPEGGVRPGTAQASVGKEGEDWRASSAERDGGAQGAAKELPEERERCRQCGRTLPLTAAWWSRSELTSLVHRRVFPDGHPNPTQKRCAECKAGAAPKDDFCADCGELLRYKGPDRNTAAAQKKNEYGRRRCLKCVEAGLCGPGLDAGAEDDGEQSAGFDVVDEPAEDDAARMSASCSLSREQAEVDRGGVPSRDASWATSGRSSSQECMKTFVQMCELQQQKMHDHAKAMQWLEEENRRRDARIAKQFEDFLAEQRAALTFGPIMPGADPAGADSRAPQLRSSRANQLTERPGERKARGMLPPECELFHEMGPAKVCDGCDALLLKGSVSLACPRCHCRYHGNCTECDGDAYDREGEVL